MIFGENLLALLVLALGAALAVGNLLALVRPRAPHDDDDSLERAPLGRSLLMIVLGLLAAVWALASLVSSDGGAEPAAQLRLESLHPQDQAFEDMQTLAQRRLTL